MIEKDYFEWEPRDVVESRNIGNYQFRYVAEVLWGNTNYVLSTPLESREAAQQIALDKCTEIRNAITQAAMKCLHGLPKAKA